MRKIRTITALIFAALLLFGCTKKPAEETVAPTAAVTKAAATEASETETASTAAEALPYEINLPEHKFTRENFPRMDGSTASVPMGQAIASTLLKEDFDSAADLCRFNRTTQSFRNLMNGDCDILVVGEPNAAVYEEMEKEGFKCEIRDIATDALIFVVNESNPVESLTTDQIRDIYSGKITNWKEVGGNDSEIIPFQRNEGAGSQALIKKLIMGSTDMAEAPKEYVIGSMGELMTAVKNYDNSADAIGYSVYYYANDMKMATGLKIIAVDGIEPNEKTIRNREYPHLNAYYCVIPENPDRSSAAASARADGARAIMKWLLTEDGQKLVASMGYVSVTDVGEGKVNKPETENLFNVASGLKAGELSEFRPGDYGEIIPYKGSVLYEDYGDGVSYVAGYMQGFFTADGTLLTDPVFSDIRRLTWWDSVTHADMLLPMFAVTIGTEEVYNEEYDGYDAVSRLRFVTSDGKVMSEKEYGVIDGRRGGVICLDSYDSDSMDFFDFEGNLLFTEKDILKANPELTEKEVYWSSTDRTGDRMTVCADGQTYILDGNNFRIISGPYSMVNLQEDGTSVVYLDENQGVLDHELDAVIPTVYDYVVRLANGNYAAVDYDHITTVFTADGKEIAKTAGGKTGITGTVYGFEEFDYDYENSVSRTRYYDCDGKLLFYDENGLFNSSLGNSILSAVGNLKEDGTIEPADDAEGVLLTDIVTGRKKYIEGYGSANPFYTIESQANIPYMHLYTIGERYDEESFMIIDTDFNTVMEGKGGCYARQDELTGEWYIIRYEDYQTEEYSVYTGKMEPYAENVKYFDTVEGGLITRTTDDFFEALSRDGNAVFRYSFGAAKND